MEKPNMIVCGVMSGTSLDGVDVAIVEFSAGDEQIDFKTLFFKTYAYENELKHRLQNIVLPSAISKDISSMNFLLGEVFADAVLEAIHESGLSKNKIDLVSSHGQTIFHDVSEERTDPFDRPNTLQIGDISVIAERTGITTIGDFRTRDVAVGGQGAPLVPFADYTLFRSHEAGRILVNIGGITNLSVIPKSATKDQVIAYDSGPGNMLIDAFTQFYTEGQKSFDANGDLANQGRIDQDWLNQLLQHPYYQLDPPKSTGREMFGMAYADQLWNEASEHNIKPIDRLTTVTALTSHTLAQAITTHFEQEHIEEVYISGGGWNNPVLIEQLKDLLPQEVKVQSTHEIGIHSDAKEAIVFALLGFLGFNKQFNNLPAATGASRDVIMGKIAW